MDVLLGGNSDHVRWDIDGLLSNGNVLLSDHDSGVMNGLGELSGSNDGLESSLHELVDSQSEDVIELLLVRFEEAELDDSSNEGVTFEESLWVSLLEGQELSGSLSEFGEGERHSPHFSLTLQPVLADDFKLTGKSVLIEWLSWGLGSFLVVCVFSWHVDLLGLCSLSKRFRIII